MVYISTMLQNRVDPWGKIIRTSARGAWMGNRGLLHDDRQEIVRPFRLKAWLICVLEFKGRRRPVMSPGQYTELFFLDEATAFSAGHRPCFECRRADANRFRSCWVRGNPEYRFGEKTAIGAIDEVLHRERTRSSEVLAGAELSDRSRAVPDGSEFAAGRTALPDGRIALPDGSFVADAGQAFLVAGGWLYPWSPFGYAERVGLAVAGRLTLLTPPSVVRAFRAGYVPQMAVSGRPAVPNS